MKIIKLRLENFKRFTDLTLDGIPPTAKLVLLIGANGSGKSCVFDAFETANSKCRGQSLEEGPKYYAKKGDDFKISLKTRSSNRTDADEFVFSMGATLGPLALASFYGRTSFRQLSKLERRSRGQNTLNISKDEDRPRSFIERDNRFENDVEAIAEDVLKDVFREGVSREEILAKYVQPVDKALDRIFGPGNGTKLRLIEIIPPLDQKTARITFKKGGSEVHYNYLSAGEKEVFNILIDLLVRREFYKDTIFFFDEIDLHLNTAIQSALLKEIVEHWIPDNCQFWTASHSLGFIDYARKSENAAIINLDDLDFDLPQILMPEPKENLDVYDVAVPQAFIFEMMQGKRIVFCENQDDTYYNLMQLPNALFVGLRDPNAVFLKVKRDQRAHSLRDRDFLSDAEIARIKTTYPQHHILRYYCFENYLYHPDNIAELNPPGFDKAAYAAELVRQKNEKCSRILVNIGSSRLGYEEFKADENLKDKESDSIVEDLTSDDFERFYKFFDMKSKFKRDIIAGLNIPRERLAQTRWMKSKIDEILSA